MNAFPLIEAKEQRVEGLLALLDGGEELTPDLEAELDAALQDSEAAILDTACRALEYEAQAERLKEWRQQAHERQKKLEERGGWLRARVRTGMEWLYKKNGKKTIPGVPVRVTLVAPRGRLEITDPALDREQDASGFTEEQVRASSIPQTLFKPITVWRLQKDLVREYLEQGQKVPGVSIVMQSSVRIMLPKEKA